MNTWKAAQWLAKTELKRELPAYTVSFILCVILALMTAESINASYPGTSHTFVDLMFLLILPVLGMAQSRVYFSPFYLGFHDRDPFTLRLQFLRSLPISTDAIVLSRFLLMAVSHICLLSIFFIVSYTTSDAYNQLLQPGQFVLFVFMWFGYSALVSGMYHYLELSVSGRTLLWASFAISLFLVGVVFILRTVDVSLVTWTIQLVQKGPLYPLLIFLLGVVGTFLWKRSLQIRIANRDLYITR